MKHLKHLLQEENGQDVIEYGLLGAFISQTDHAYANGNGNPLSHFKFNPRAYLFSTHKGAVCAL